MNRNVSEKTDPGLDTETLYRDLFTPLFRYVYFRTHDYDLACDITQTTFLKYLSDTTPRRSIEHAHKQLFVIARNTLIDHWRSAPVRRTEWSSELDERGSNDQSAETRLIAQEDNDLLRKLIDSLSSCEIEAVTLRLAGDVSYAAVATILHESEANVRQIYSRALKKLRAHFVVDHEPNPKHGITG